MKTFLWIALVGGVLAIIVGLWDLGRTDPHRRPTGDAPATDARRGTGRGAQTG